jgi:hypothetical protein
MIKAQGLKVQGTRDKEQGFKVQDYMVKAKVKVKIKIGPSFHILPSTIFISQLAS